MTRVVTNGGALRGALLPGLTAISLRKATAGAADAARRSRVDTGAMRAGWKATPLPGGAARVSSGPEYTVYNEYGTSRMAAQPMARPSMPIAAAA